MSENLLLRFALTGLFAMAWLSAQRSLNRDGALATRGAFTARRMWTMSLMLAGLTGCVSGGLDIARMVVWHSV